LVASSQAWFRRDIRSLEMRQWTINVQFLALTALCLWPLHLCAWTNGQLLIWMDSEPAVGLRPIAKKFANDLGIKVTIETPVNIVDNFPLAAQAGQGPDIVIWAHDKVGEWADSGLIAPVKLSSDLVRKLYPQAWEAVRHREAAWGYPIALETITLIYNKKLLVGSAPTDLSQLVSINRLIQAKHPGARTILWDYKSAYYSWGILASAGGYVFKRRRTIYDVKDIGVATAGAVEGLSKIVALVRNGILPIGPVNGEGEELMAEGKLAMTISGPWDWPNLIASGIDFGLAPIPGIEGRLGRPFVGVTLAYLSRSSPNQDLAKEFLEHYLLTDDGLGAINRAKPIGIPALISSYEKLAPSDIRLRQLKVAVDLGQVMPNIPQMGRFFNAVGTALQIATDGQASAGEALREAAMNM
jgi:maltose/maltodextrin transport system substrate-binding protein